MTQQDERIVGSATRKQLISLPRPSSPQSNVSHPSSRFALVVDATEAMTITLKLTSLLVNDQEKALNFYTEIIGFAKITDKPAGAHRWLTVGPKGSTTTGLEMVLEPNVHKAAKVYQKALFDQGIPATMLFVDNLDAEIKRLKDAGVEFDAEPVEYDGNRLAKFNNTCGNWIMLVDEMNQH